MSLMSEPVDEIHEADLIQRVCASCGDIQGKWEGGEIEEILTDDGAIKQGYGGACTSCGAHLVEWEFLRFVEVA